jgi:V8-like Glu-specific endopeptidase
MLISRRHVLTAGHCVFDLDVDGDGYIDDDGGAWLDFHKVYMHPASGVEVDTSTATGYDVTNVWAVSGWTYFGLDEWDYAVIELDSSGYYYPGTLEGWLGFAYSDSITTSYTWNAHGFPSSAVDSRDRGAEWYYGHYDGTHKATDYMIQHTLDTSAGQSGAGLYYYNTDWFVRQIYGIHRGWSNLPGETADACTYNNAVRITYGRFFQFCAWIAEDAGSWVC